MAQCRPRPRSSQHKKICDTPSQEDDFHITFFSESGGFFRSLGMESKTWSEVTAPFRVSQNRDEGRSRDNPEKNGNSMGRPGRR